MDMTKVLSISIHALLTESDWLLGTEFQTLPLISIHALLTESDAPLAHHPRDSQISIHALLTESDVKKKTYRSSVFVFQSTLSLRRATGKGLSHPLGGLHFNPRSPCGERRYTAPNDYCSYFISIHALLAESDFTLNAKDPLIADFNPRSPCGERRVRISHKVFCRYFNPRSPCGERRAACPMSLASPTNFNPRSPCGERPPIPNASASRPLFQSTLSLRRAT